MRADTQSSMREVVLTNLMVCHGTPVEQGSSLWLTTLVGTPLERDISYVADQAERAMEGVGRIEQRLEEQVHVQAKLRSSIDSQTEALNDLFRFLGFDPKA